MQKTITICIVDDILFPETKPFLNVFSLLEETTHISLSDRTGICVIELPKVNPEKKAFEELTPLERSLEYLNRADEKGSEEQDELVRLGGKELEMVQHLLKKVTEEEILREKALAREKYLQDEAHFEFLRKDTMKMQEENARQQRENARQQEENRRQQEKLETGRQELKEEQQKLKAGQQELMKRQRDIMKKQQELDRQLQEQRDADKRALAKMLKADNVELERIVAYTGLSRQEIQKL